MIGAEHVVDPLAEFVPSGHAMQPDVFCPVAEYVPVAQGAPKHKPNSENDKHIDAKT